ESAKWFEQAFDRLATARPGVSVLIGSGPGEFAREGQRWGGHGVVTRHLACGLFDRGDKGGEVAGAIAQTFTPFQGRRDDDTSAKQHPWQSGAMLTQAAAPRVEQQVATTSSGNKSEPVASANSPTAAQPKPAESTNASKPTSRSEQKLDVPSNKAMPPSEPQA